MTQGQEVVGPARVRIGYWINQGWDWFVDDLGMHVLIGLISVIFLNIGVIFIAGPVFAGLALAGLRKSRGKRLEVKDYFDGFRYFLPSLLSTLVVTAFSFVGFLLLIIPGLVIMAMYQLTYHFIVDQDQDFWEAMESSRKVVSQDYFGFTVFGVLLGLINLLGLLFMGVGVLASIPITSLAVTAAYLDFRGQLVPRHVPPSQAVRIE